MTDPLLPVLGDGIGMMQRENNALRKENDRMKDEMKDRNDSMDGRNDNRKDGRRTIRTSLGSIVEVHPRLNRQMVSLDMINGTTGRQVDVALEHDEVKRLIKALKAMLPEEEEEVPESFETGYGRKLRVIGLSVLTYLKVQDTDDDWSIETVLDREEVKLLRRMLKG